MRLSVVGIGLNQGKVKRGGNQTFETEGVFAAVIGAAVSIVAASVGHFSSPAYIKTNPAAAFYPSIAADCEIVPRRFLRC